MKKRYYAAILIIAVATFLLLAGVPSWLSIASLTTISVVLFALTREEIPPQVLAVGKDEFDVLLTISEGANTIKAISSQLGIAWGTARKRIDSLSKLGLIYVRDGTIIMTEDGEKLVEFFNSQFSETSNGRTLNFLRPPR